MMLLAKLAGALTWRPARTTPDGKPETPATCEPDDAPAQDPQARTEYQRRQDREIAEAESRTQFHRGGPGCAPTPYQGPILLGRRGEPITEGRPS